MTDLELVEKLKNLFGDKIVEISNPALRRVFMTIAPGNVAPVFAGLSKDLHYTYIATISGLDSGDSYEILYHLADLNGNLNVRTRIPKAEPHLVSICPSLPGAILYERELQDMFGIVIEVSLVATALALIINIYRHTKSLDVRNLAKLKG